MKMEKRVENDSIVFESNMFDARTGSISVNGTEEIYLESRLKDFFSVLLDHQNTVLTREELMDFVWKDIVVSEESISKAVSDLRKFFQTNGFSNIKITTISKVGYKLEIDEQPNSLNKSSNQLKLGLKIIGFTILIVFLLIVIVRALRYEQ